MNNLLPYDWVDGIDEALLELDEKPQFGSVGPFPWAELKTKLDALFKKSTLELNHQQVGWVEEEKRLEGLGEKLHLQQIIFSPLNASVVCAVAEQDLVGLLTVLLGGNSEVSSLVDKELLDGFSDYFYATLLQQIHSLPFVPSLTPKMGEALKPETLKKEPSFRTDVSLAIRGHTFWGRILISKEFRNEFKAHVSTSSPTLADLAASDTGQKIPLDVALELGAVDLPIADWKKAKENDFIVLDKCSYDPDTKKGRLVLTLGNRPIFRGKLTKEGLKLLEYPFYGEVDNVMDDSLDEDEEEDLYGEFDEDEDEEFDEEFEDEEDAEEELQQEVKADTLQEPEKSLEPKASLEAKEIIDEGQKSVSPDEIPIHLTIEVGKIRMNAKELLNLSAGNVLPLNVTPEQGVNLVVSGKKVGRGELIRVGEVLGVRILQL